MDKRKIINSSLFFLIIFSILLEFIPMTESALKCAPDFKSKGDNYSSVDDPQDNFEYFYGYEFAHRAGEEYYDHWKGIYWDKEQFCYDAYDNFTRPEKLSDLGEYPITDCDVVTSLDDVGDKKSYVLIEHDQTNLANFHKKMCMTNNHTQTIYNHGEYELLIKMDRLFEEEFLDKPYHFIFTIENPSNDTITFSFKARNFINTTEEKNFTIYEFGPNVSQCIEEEEEEVTDKKEEEKENEEPKDNEDGTDQDSDITKENDVIEAETEPVKPTTPPCERENITINETFLNWTEEYPIPEVFYLTNNYTIEPHKSMIVNVSVTFEKNDNETEGGYFIISEETGNSSEPFYWPGIYEDNGKNEKLANMEIILESDLSVGVSSFSLMRRRDLEENSYLGQKCNMKYINEELNGRCGDGFYCDKPNNGTCKPCSDRLCKNCDKNTQKCTECFLISVDGQWNPPGGKGTDLKCDLDYIDITKVRINDGKKIEVPPAIHWRVTMDFWIWISDTSVLSEAQVNMNIVYKDFLAMTLRCFPNGLRIFATPIEWLYEYPTFDEDKDSRKKYYYRTFMEGNRTSDIYNFLKSYIGSYDEVTLEDLVKNATSNWVYVRYAFNLDSSKHYLNDLPESNLRVPQIYSDQTGMPFHMKRFYGLNKNTYLYFNNFFDPLTETQKEAKKNITIYLRNFNIFREYIPQKILTKYYNLHKIDNPKKFPQLLLSFPFSNIEYSSADTYKMKGYNYYIRENDGQVNENGVEIKDYQLKVDPDYEVKTFRPPRNFWRLNLLELNKQPENCDFENMIPLQCTSPSEYCFDVDKPFICKEGTQEKPYYLNLANLECKTHCEINYMHPPRYSTYNQRLFCSHFCDSGNKQCPSDEVKYTDVYTNFLCTNDFFNLYYKCYSKNEALNNAQFSGMLFSDFLRTPTVFIELPESYEQFEIDFWYYPDLLLRFRRYLDYDIEDEKKYVYNEFKNPTSEENRVIFLSDCCKVTYGDSSTSVLRFYTEDGKQAASNGANIAHVVLNSWNHFVLTFFKILDKNAYSFYMTFKNQQYEYMGDYYRNIQINYDYGGYWKTSKTGIKLKRIIFCTQDPNVVYAKVGSTFLVNECKNAQWLDGYYRKLQVFDLKYSAKVPMFSNHQFEDDGVNIMIKHRYLFGLNSISNNRLIDTIGGAHGYALLSEDLYVKQNPDQANYILYQTNFSPEGGVPNYGYEYIYEYKYTAPRIQEKHKGCTNTRCGICQSGSNCLSCKEGFSLFSKECKGNIDANEKPAQYYYKNPGKNMPETISLKMDFDKIANEPYFTIFFFIKIYGFTKDTKFDEPIKLLIFHQERDSTGKLVDDFYLAWDPREDEKEKLSFYVNGKVMYSYNYFREYLFGYWVPISITAFREEDRRFKMNMVQAAILYYNVQFDEDYKPINYLFPYVKFTQFSITNKWVGLLSDVKIFNKFIVNAWGILKHQYLDQDDSADDIPDSAIEEYILRSDTKDSCLLTSQIVNQQAAGYKVECVSDYNPHYYKFCGSMEAQTVRYHQGDAEGGNYLCKACCSSDTKPHRCLGGHPSDSCGAWDVDHSCENQTPIWKPTYLTFDSNRIVCNRLYYIDYNRFKYARSNNVESPQDVWAIDFWFKTSTNQAVTDRTYPHTFATNNGNNNNFVEFIIEWNYHLRIRVYKVVESERESKFSYEVECTPLVVLEHPDLDTPEKITNNIGNVHYKWAYVTCGANFQEKVFYMTNNNRFTKDVPFTSKLVLIPSAKTTLSITENSRTGYGFTIIYQLRLWHCYNCAHAFRNLDYAKGDKNFNAVYHNFDGSGISDSVTQSFSDQAGNAKATTMTQAADFPGYTLNWGPGEPVLCDETLYEYYSEENNQCERHFNMARSPYDFKRTIPSSRNGRYTMDFWFFVENSAELSPGINLFWEYHMSITLLRDTANKNTINAICFPQSYRDNVDGKGGQDIIEIYDKALNKDKYAFYQGSQQWNFVRCAVDQTRKKFFINDNLELDLEGEILYGSERNYRPFRFFKISSEHDLKFQNARFNPTRIFIRQIKCYRDYIDFRLMELKYKTCGNGTDSSATTHGYWYDCQFYPLVFCFDYGENVNPYWPCTHSRYCFDGRCNRGAYNCGLYYSIYRENKDQTISVSGAHWWDLLREDIDQYYPTFPDIYRPQFCLPGVSGGDKKVCSGSVSVCHLGNSTALFWPQNKAYLELDTLKEVSQCDKACRPPDSYYAKNYCLIKFETNNMVTCSDTQATALTYFDRYECKPGYVKVYYECIDQNLVSKSAMYFSNVYSFPNVIFNAPGKGRENEDYLDWKQETRLASYYIEVWIKFDALNYREQITEIQHYLYAHPHQIIKDPIDQKYKYSNKLISQGSYYYTLNSMHNYEWNKIIIENYYDPVTTKFSIKLYLNYEFENPELSIPDLESSIYKLHFRGFGFCDKTDSYCRVNDDPVYLRWGVAWYRNFRVWDADITSLQTIQACEYGYTQFINAQKYYFSLTVDMIEKNTIKDRINSDNKMVLNYWIFHQENYFKEAFDNAMRENYSTDNFDKTFVFENNYISGLNEDGTDYLISACASECKRCYSSANTDCYECKLGYSIYGKQCKIRTGYFLKTPPNNTLATEIGIKIKDEDTYFDLETQTHFTITLYIKFFGIELSKVVDGVTYYILVCFYKDTSNNCLTYIGYNYDDKTIVFVVNGEEIYASKAKNYVGVWTHFGISVHKKIENEDPFPNMLNFMIDQKELIPKPGFDPTKDPITINIFSIYTAPICFYSSFKVFSTFYFGPYGHINAIGSTRGNKLIYQVNLYGSSNNNCITDANLVAYPGVYVNIKTLIPVCIADYQPYEDTNNICSDDDHFMDVIYKVSPPCELCDSSCVTNCFSLESSECTCDYYEGLYWVKTDDEYQSYECQRVDSINFAFYASVTINGISVVKNDEMAIVFWLDIYEYLDNKFESLEIIWNQHLAVIIKGNGQQGENKFLSIECHGDYDIADPEMTHTVIYDNGRKKFNRWNYIVCQADKFHKLIKVNDLAESEEYTPVTYTQKSVLTSSLSIEDKTTNFNYGFSFVRELKLFSSYNFDFWDESHHNIKKEHFDFLLHYFHNDFSQLKLSEAKITDQVGGLVTKLTVKPGRVGYNYVIDYDYLVICEEGYVYNEVSKRCDIFDSVECIVPKNSSDSCLLCAANHPYLKDDDKCYDDCSPDYFADTYFKQCRRCNFTCHTCFGKKYDNCLSCTGIYYYIESLHICVTNCQEYGLVVSKKLNNTCEELLTESYISVPVFLNNSYDYDPKNEDFVSKIINRDIFQSIEGHLGKVSTTVETLWVYNRTETININKEYRYYEEADIPDRNPITSDATKLKIDVDNGYFKYGYKYVFDLQIYSQNGFFSTTHTHTYILMMNDYPLVGTINILPAEGYITNLFLMTINKCKDDVSEKHLLKYKFSYFKRKEATIYGFNDEGEEEIVIQNWSKKSEALFQFKELNPDEDYKYYIRGYCMDEFGLYYSEIQEMKVIDIPTNSKVDIPLEESIAAIDINEDLEIDQLLNRAEFMSTTTVDYDKGIELMNRTNITIYNKKGILQENLVKNDPSGSNNDFYCNERGDSYMVYFYLVCDCHGFTGAMCQVDHASHDFMLKNYNDLFLKIKMMQTGKYEHELIKSVNLLMKSAATFMDVDNMDFMLESIDFINLYRNKFTEEMMEGNNFEMYFDIYNSLIEYGLSIVNNLKYRNFIAKNSKNSAGRYNEDKFRNATLAKGEPEIVQDYFNKIKVSLQNLLEFYASNKKEVRFINKNINVYATLIDENFEFDSYFDKEKRLYQPYMSFQRCLEQTMIQSQGNPNYRVYLSAIVWKVSPYMSKEELYWNTTSPVITFKFLDYDTGEKIYLSNCGDEDDQIQLYFPVNNYKLVDRINAKKAYLSPENQFDLNDDIFCDPVYINKSGAVFNSTPEERREEYFLGFNFSCNYYNVKSEDQSNIKMTKETLDYHKYTKENYIQCLSNKLVQESYGEFVVDSYSIPAEFHLNSRFFYLKHYQLLSWKDNYTANQAFYYYLILGITYAGLSLAYIYFEKFHYIKMQRLGELKTEITKMNLPYREEYIFNNDLQVEEEVKGKLKDKRKPNMEEMNLDTNNVDVDIMADEISKFNKGFKSKENALGFNPEYFGIKEKKQLNMNSQFFPGEVDMRKPQTNNDDDISPEKLAKMKKFYQVGFKGLDTNENTKKEMQISKDKKRVLIKKQENLGKIVEIDEDDALDIDIANKNFFNNDNDEDFEEDEKEKETTLKRRNKKNKFQDNMDKYKEFVSSTEHLNSESQLKSSKRETATKKFFGSNPPKKERGKKINSLIFTEKDQQKKGSKDAKFFRNDDNLDLAPNKNKRKPKNLFQKDYDNLYKPGFKGPKVVSENLGFYTRETIDFEQENDTDNKNPPYFGKRFRKIKSKQEKEKSKGLNAGMRVGFYFKNKQIDLNDEEEQLPMLAENLTFEQKMEEFYNYSISFKGFLFKNIKSRYILLTTFDRMSIVYERYMRAGNFAAQLSIFALFLSIFFTSDEKQTLFVSKDKNQIGNFILYCFCSDILGCLAAHLPAYCFWVNDKKFRKLYTTIRNDGGINVLKQMEDIIKKGRLFWNILGIIIQIVYIVMGFYFAFGFCATYYYQRSTFTLALICTCGFDFLISEFLWEIIIGLLFYVRNWGRVIVFFGTLLNTLRNIKHLV